MSNNPLGKIAGLSSLQQVPESRVLAVPPVVPAATSTPEPIHVIPSVYNERVLTYLHNLELQQKEGRLLPYENRDMLLSEGDLSMSNTARLLGTGLGRLRDLLEYQQVLIAKGMHFLPQKHYVDAGLIKFFPASFRRDGKPAYFRVFVTPKGRQWLHAAACKGGLDAILDRTALISRTPKPVRPFALALSEVVDR